MKVDFEKRMIGKTNLELYKIVEYQADNYESEALFFAKLELDKRMLSEYEINELKREITHDNMIRIIKGKEDLENFQRFLFFIFCFGILPWAMAETFRVKGYTKKYKDAWRFMRLGLLFYGTLLFIMFLFAIIFIVK